MTQTPSTSAAADRAKQVAAAIVTQMCYTDPMWDGGAAESAQDLMVPIIQKALEAQQTDTLSELRTQIDDLGTEEFFVGSHPRWRNFVDKDELTKLIDSAETKNK